MSDTTESTVVLSLKQVRKSFGTNTAVDITDLEVKRGEIFGFLGPNGAGKSTTIRLVLDILRPDSGAITILGQSNRKVSATHTDIGFLSGDMVIDTDLTGRQYLQLVSNLHGGGHSAAIARLADTLEARLDVKIGQYSRGNRQKIGLIAALLHGPKLLILDEPTSGFDPLVQEKFAELIRDYVAGGGTVFMSSHVLTEVQHLCDRVAFIKGGRIITTTTVSDLLDTNAKRVHVTAAAATLSKISKTFASVKGLSKVEARGDTMAFSYAGSVDPLLHYFAGMPLHDITIREPELDEIFGHYYEDEPTESEDEHA